MMTDLRKAAQQALEALNNTHDVGCAETQDAITALRAALTQPDVPEGFVLVTEAMKFEGARSLIDGQESRHGSSWAEEAELCFRAMLAAAPKGGA